MNANEKWPRDEASNVDLDDNWRAKLQVGDRCDATDKHGKWWESEIMEVQQNAKTVKVHFRGWAHRWDEVRQVNFLQFVFNFCIVVLLSVLKKALIHKFT